MYEADRGAHKVHGSRLGDGGVAVIDFATEKIIARWGVPGGRSPDLGNVSADGKCLWLAARNDDVGYCINAASIDVAQIEVGAQSRTGSRCGRNMCAVSWGTPAICADAARALAVDLWRR